MPLVILPQCWKGLRNFALLTRGLKMADDFMREFLYGGALKLRQTSRWDQAVRAVHEPRRTGAIAESSILRQFSGACPYPG